MREWLPSVGRAINSSGPIPPVGKTYQSDVGTVHRLIEDEFYRTEDFYSTEDFLKKASSYQPFFNVARKNSYKGDLSPLQIIKERTPQIDPKVILITPVFLNELTI